MQTNAANSQAFQASEINPLKSTMRQAKLENPPGQPETKKVDSQAQELASFLDPQTLNLINENLTGEVVNQLPYLDFDSIFGDPPTDYTDLKLLSTGRDTLRIMNSPADPPVMLTAPEVTLRLDEGVSMSSEWPPESAKFTNPQTGEETLGFRVEMSTGDTYFVPEGSKLTIATHNDQFTRGTVYQLDENGDADQREALAARYASVFAI